MKSIRQVHRSMPCQSGRKHLAEMGITLNLTYMNEQDPEIVRKFRAICELITIKGNGVLFNIMA